MQILPHAMQELLRMTPQGLCHWPGNCPPKKGPHLSGCVILKGGWQRGIRGRMASGRVLPRISATRRSAALGPDRADTNTTPAKGGTLNGKEYVGHSCRIASGRVLPRISATRRSAALGPDRADTNTTPAKGGTLNGKEYVGHWNLSGSNNRFG